jgi:5-oxoprolinase (ATP-hydrolysing)
MPPHSKYLWEEGATFKSFKLVNKGDFKEKELVHALLEEPAQHPGCAGTRCLQDNLSDLKAQVAANQKGILLVSELIDYYGLDVVQSYMTYIQENAEVAVREMLKEMGKNALEMHGTTSLEAEDLMDCGSKIKLKIDINAENGSAIFDFTGTSCEVWGNLNAPKAVTLSALIYSLRSCREGYSFEPRLLESS